MLFVEVVYASPTDFRKVAIRVPLGITIEQAISQSNLQAYFPEIDLTVLQVGIFGELKPLNHCVQAGDRVEIYRPLSHDPMQTRKQKAIKAKKIKQKARHV